MLKTCSSSRLGGTLPKRTESGVAHCNSKRRTIGASIICRIFRVSGLAARRNDRLVCRTCVIFFDSGVEGLDPDERAAQPR